MEEKMDQQDPPKTSPAKSGNTSYWVAGVVALIIIIGIIWYAGARKQGGLYSSSNQARQSQDDQSAQTSGEQKEASAVIIYTDSGFSPQQGTMVKVGETVEFKNESSGGMWVASAQHPLHSDYDGTTLSEHCAAGAASSFDSCRAIQKGDSYFFTFEKAGTWKFHNHADPTKFGSVTVQ